MSLDENKIEDSTTTFGETLRNRGYSEEYIQAALERRLERMMREDGLSV